MTAQRPKAPAGLGKAGRALWGSVTSEFDLAEHELALLRQASSTLDAIARLQASLDADDVMDASPQGRRVHPALPELRQQRVVFARLIAQLGVPVGDEAAQGKPAAKPQRRAARGVYAIRSVG